MILVPIWVANKRNNITERLLRLTNRRKCVLSLYRLRLKPRAGTIQTGFVLEKMEVSSTSDWSDINFDDENFFGFHSADKQGGHWKKIVAAEYR